MAKDDDDDFSPSEEQYLAGLCDISDVRFFMPANKSRTRITLIIESETDFNLMKFYLSLKAYVEKIELEIGVMDATEDVH